MVDTTAFGKRVKDRRDNINMKQAEVVERLSRLGVKVDVSTLSRLERGRGGENPPFDLIRGLTQVLGVTLDWLVDGDSPSAMLAFERFRGVDALQKALVAMSAWYIHASEADRRAFERDMEAWARKLNEPGSTESDRRGIGGGAATETADTSGDQDASVDRLLDSAIR